MIYFSETPTRKNHAAAILALLFGLCGIAVFTCARFFDFSAVLQTIGIVLMMVTVVLLGSTLVKYTYTIQKSDKDERDELAVIEQRGQKQTTICRLLLSDLCKYDVCAAKEEKAVRRAYHADRIHSYCPDIFASRVVYLLFEENGERIVLRLQASEQFMDVLKRMTGK
ncbi:MAG: hypothetical protein E7605_03580 [Ruminococcaceae bacterium]|nr:hypothetical protein [Oscillospiraceae bacterium]